MDSAMGQQPKRPFKQARFHRDRCCRSGLGGRGRLGILGVGGSHIGEIPEEDLAIGIIRAAIDRGANFMDNSWDYNQGTGRDELRTGKAAGKVRYIGFTGHNDPAIHPRMIQMAKEKGFRFDAALLPSNVMDWSFRCAARLSWKAKRRRRPNASSTRFVSLHR
jgi:hypothetical protein